ncbi:MAG: phosphatase PAP2 family protein [Candidatus Latescibacteria bacterium]|nr:phosphatase PAP2 family protein [Candidatus Latescibacterota bacterium]
MRRSGAWAVLLLALWGLPAAADLSGVAPALRADFQRLGRPGSLGLVAAALAGGALVHRWDDEVKSPLVERAAFKRLLDAGNAYGSSLNALGGLAGVWVLGRTTGQPVLQTTAIDLGRSLLLANAMVVPIKEVARRRRPDGSNRRSFPSGHSANAFAMSTTLARRHGVRVGAPFLALAALTPLARIQDRRHYLSDVVTGGVLGIAAGLAVGDPAGRVALLPMGPAGSWGLAVQVVSK